MVEHETLMSSIFGNVALVLCLNQHLTSFEIIQSMYWTFLMGFFPFKNHLFNAQCRTSLRIYKSKTGQPTLSFQCSTTRLNIKQGKQTADRLLNTQLQFWIKC